MRKIYKMMSLLTFAILAMTACQTIDDVDDNTPTTNPDNIANSNTQIGSYFAFIGVDEYYKPTETLNYYACLYSDENAEEPIQRVTFNGRSFDFYHLSPLTTYYYKVVFEIDNPEYYKESPLLSFTTLPGVACGNITYTDWNGETYPFTEFSQSGELPCYFYSGSNSKSNTLLYEGEMWRIAYQVDGAEDFTNVCTCYPYYKINYSREFYAYTSKEANEQYMYGNGVINPETFKFDINMVHATARVIMNISIDPEINLQSAYISGMSLGVNSVVPTSGYISMENGKISKAFYESITFGGGVTLKSGYSHTLTFYPLPATNEGVVTFYANIEGGSTLTLPIELTGDQMWKAGNTYTYNIVYTPQELRITSVNVQGWNEVNGGDVIIKN